jgi:hypothetical protein
MQKIEKHPSSFRFRNEVMEKLDKIREYHQKHVDNETYGNDRLLSKRMILQGLIETEYFKMVQEGLIKDE